MSYLDNYKNRLGHAGDNLRDAHKQSAKSMLNNNFSNSPSYTTFLVDGVSADGLMQSDKTSDMRVILFRPDIKYDRGSYVNISGEEWLLTDFNGSDIYPKAMLQRCNDILTWKDGDGVTHSYGCVINSNATLYRFGFVPDRMMDIVNMEFHVFAKYDQNTSKIKENLRLMFGDKSFEVMAIDAVTAVIGGVGIVRFHVKADIVRDSDVPSGIADNKKPKPRDGKLW